jgi:hypothetical protein
MKTVELAAKRIFAILFGLVQSYPRKTRKGKAKPARLSTAFAYDADPPAREPSDPWMV